MSGGLVSILVPGIMSRIFASVGARCRLLGGSHTGDRESESVGVLRKESLQESRLSSTRGAGDHDWTELLHWIIGDVRFGLSHCSSGEVP